MNIRFLEAFIWVGKLRSFRAAADKLNITQAAISSRIAALEVEFGTKLFERNSRTVAPTMAAVNLLRYAEQMLALSRDMKNSLKVEGPSGLVRIGSVESVVHTWLVPFLESLRLSHPNVQFELIVEPTTILHEHLKRGIIDVAFHATPLLASGIRDVQLPTLEMNWIANSTDKRFSSKMALADILAWPVITFTRGSQPYLSVVEAFRLAGVAPQTLHSVTSIAVMTKLLGSRFGVATLPRAAVADEIHRKQFRVITSDHRLPALPIIASYREDPGNPAHDAIVELAMESSTMVMR